MKAKALKKSERLKEIRSCAQDAVRKYAPSEAWQIDRAWNSWKSQADQERHNCYYFSPQPEFETDEELDAWLNEGQGAEESRAWEDALEDEMRQVEQELDQQDDERRTQENRLLKAAEKEFVSLFPNAGANLKQGGGASSHYFNVYGYSMDEGKIESRDGPINYGRNTDSKIIFRVADHAPAYAHDFDFRYDFSDNESLKRALTEMLKAARKVAKMIEGTMKRKNKNPKARRKKNPSDGAPAVYVGTYGKYNNGSIAGKWLKLSDYASYEDFIDAARKVHKDERDPELMFQDYENFPKRYYSESYINPKVFDWIALSEDEQEMLEAYLEEIGDDDATIEDAQDRFQGVYDSEEDWAMQYIEEIGGPGELGESAAYYIYVDPTTARQIGLDEADSRVSDMRDQEIIDEAGAEEVYEAAGNLEASEQELEELEDEQDEMDSDEYEEKKAELERQIEEYKALAEGKSQEKIVDEARDDLLSSIADDVERSVKRDAVGYFVDELGAYTLEDLAKADFVSFDYEKFAREVEMNGDIRFSEHNGRVYAFSNR